VSTRRRAGACLSLSGKFAPFGQQAARGLQLWADEADVDLVVADDESTTETLTEQLGHLAPQVDLLFGPYSTLLMRPAIQIARDAHRVLFNHGGSGGSLSAPGVVVNILTPARRYALPFVRFLDASDRAPLYVTDLRGAFGRDVVAGAVQEARRTGRRVETFDVDSPPTGTWHLLSAGVYEDDVATVRGARSLANRPRYICSVAVGVAQFADDVDDPQGILGIGQWTPGAEFVGSAGMDETDFLESWQRRFGGVPDYPGVQAYAAGVVAAAAVQSAGTAESGALWQEVIGMDMQTVFGRFRLDAENGEQIGHEAVLTQWRAGKICPLLQRGA
jgi:ABC-type branched-subunit amino acid transport system substrate-binding protein